MKAKEESRRELERLLENDLLEVEVLQENLTKSIWLNDKINAMINSFDHRLENLEQSIIPIHSATQSLTRGKDNISKALNQVGQVLAYLDLAAKVEPQLAKAPARTDLVEYLNVLEETKSALLFLQASPYKSSERGVQALREVLRKASVALNQLFRSLIIELCTQSTSQHVASNTTASAATTTTTTMAGAGSEATAAAAARPAPQLLPVEAYTKTYTDVRGAALQRLLGPSLQYAKDIDAQRSLIYERGTSPLVAIAAFAMPFFRAERELAQRVLPKAAVPDSFVLAITPCMTQLLAFMRSTIQRTRRALEKAEFTDIYMLLDVIQGLSTLSKAYHGIITAAAALGLEWFELIGLAKRTAIEFFPRLYDSVVQESQGSRATATAPDAIVHEMTSVALNTLRRLVEYQPAMAALLQEGGGPILRSVQVPTFTAFCIEMLSALAMSLMVKSRAYKRTTLAMLFLLNNFHFIHKQLFEGPLASVVEAKVVAEAQKETARWQNAYLDTWKPILDVLLDQHFVQGTKTLSKPQRGTIKEAWKTFNDQFDDIIKSQSAATIAEPALRAQVLTEVQRTLLPVYQRFYDRYTTIEFSKTPEKYIKYTRAQIQELVSGLFSKY
ncbi:hypothetical protein CXG81DRAFT_9163 [Caulochytrium protostelioides]|uniref:Exocyst complex protein EXO70 n=1 Tax=Caulochytrium protostelioides TaxID=1555241 RepID=A0A4P9XE04_9FUNG|nr:hypothetical protein CXG81DRAFT_9163 [Caulochytrium protostelioides]|eukprot:RKP03722.1 hypothetical protein CXG81DRAFT_9163 [Caulochytrium protostelioides]